MDVIYNWILNTKNKTANFKIIACNYSGSNAQKQISGYLFGGTFMLFGYRKDKYACITAFLYGAEAPISVGTINNGVWVKRFEKVVLTSDLGYIDCSVTTGANIQVSIPGAPPTNLGYIPVIVGHGTTSSALDNVFYDAGAWRIYSTHAQSVAIRFYKYPV